MPGPKPHTIGLTGSIGMGKSTVSGFFKDAGADIWDADAAVHRLYDLGGSGVPAIEKIAPNTITSGKVDRAALSAAIRAEPALLERVEAVIHPLVAADREHFRQNSNAKLCVFDIPLLLEGENASEFDTIVVVSAPASVQMDRVLARPGMTPEKFAFILSRQMPDAQKRKRADFVIETDCSFDDTRDQVNSVLEQLGLR